MKPLYSPVPGWGRLPEGWSFVEVAGVATDSRDNVYVFNRGERPVIVFEKDGTFLYSWGDGQLSRSHGITIGPDDSVYLTFDRDHTVRKYTPDGRPLMTLGVSCQPSDTGIESFDYRTIKHGGPPFNYPTNVALGSNGEIYVADGYGNARVHKFSAEGTLLLSWGEPGSGIGQFNIPHGIAVDQQGRVIVADRENSRLQFFSPAGKFLEEWTDIVRPTQVFIDPGGRIFVSELGTRAGLWPWLETPPNPTPGRVSVFDSAGRFLARWGNDDPMAPDGFYAPHGICLDSHGSIYVAEVTMSAGGYKGRVPANCPCLRKYVVSTAAESCAR
jgi:DNA-binding beta-propeller fold protein YncE